jgi:hypothetical protein
MKRFILTFLFFGGMIMSQVYEFPPVIIHSVNLVGGKIEVAKSQIDAIQCAFSTWPSSWLSKKVWKEIYAAKNGTIVLEKVIEGKIIPAQDEKWDFPE